MQDRERKLRLSAKCDEYRHSSLQVVK